MPYTLPTTIRRSYTGLFLIFLVGAVVEGFLIYLGGKIAAQPNTAPIVPQLAMFMAVVVGLIVIVSMWVYWGAKLVLTDKGLQVLRFHTLFWSTQSTVSWADVEEVTISSPGILKGLTGIGGILVQSAGSVPNLSITWIGNVDSLRDFIAAQADAADNGSSGP